MKIQDQLNHAVDAWIEKHRCEPTSIWLSPRIHAMLEEEVRGGMTLSDGQVLRDRKFRGATLRSANCGDEILVGVAEAWPKGPETEAGIAPPAPFAMTLADITLAREALAEARKQLQDLVAACIPLHVPTLAAESAASLAKVALKRLDEIQHAPFARIG
jgi:hypothetical protein